MTLAYGGSQHQPWRTATAAGDDNGVAGGRPDRGAIADGRAGASGAIAVMK